MTGSTMQLEAGDALLEIEPRAGGRISRLRVGRHDLLVPSRPDPISWGCFPMAPWAGRVGGARFEWGGSVYDLEPTMPPHAIHGTVHRRPWDVVDARTIRTELGPEWPFAGEAIQRFRLTNRTLEVVLELHALHRPFPATVGWHPWFRRTIAGTTATLRIQAASMYERGADHLPTGRLIRPSSGPWDDAFTGLMAPVEITWGGCLHLSVESDLDHVVLYDEATEGLCVEPQSGPPDAFALRRCDAVAPGRPLTATMRWCWTVPGRDG